MRSYGLMGIELQFCKKERILEMGGADGCTTKRIVLNSTVLYI